MFRVAISGSYGGLNLGDEAILQSIVAQLRRSLPVEITVFSREAKDTLERHRVERAVSIRTLTRDEARAEVERLDLLILGGGGILYDRDAEAYLREVTLAHEIGVPVMVYAISAGPLQTRATREAVREALNRAAVITVRDRQGRQLLEEVGVTQEIQVTADPALLMEPEPLPEEAWKREGFELGGRLVGFSVREPGPAAPDIDVEHYHALLANAADFMVDRLDAEVVFMPLERKKMDVQHSHAVISRMQHAQQATVLKGDYTSGQLISLIGQFEFCVGMRLHFLIFAAIQNVPFVALPYASKVAGFVEDLQMEVPPLKHVNTGQLIAYIDRSWDHRNEIRERIRRLLPEIQARARQTNELAVQLLSQRVGSPATQGE
jgi:polysaccharide pyruvyl transferase CsaB